MKSDTRQMGESPTGVSWKHRLVRLVTALLLFGALVIPIEARAQSERVSVTGKNLSQVFKEIEKQTHYTFVYRDNINANAAVRVNKKNRPVSEILREVLSPMGLTYSLNNRTITIVKSEKPAKNVDKKDDLTIAGQVQDSEGEPLIGATIMVKGTNVGTATDIEGNYTLDNVPADGTLTVSYIGYAPRNIKVSDAVAQKRIVLQSLDSTLDEVVVVGYGATSRKNLTTSIATVKADKVSKSSSPTVQGLLLGHAAGVQSNVQSTQPGGAINISIRGGGDPLYVVDGVVMPTASLETSNAELNLPANVQRGGLVGLNPSDIESVEVLKDASAAIYGIGAANGVVLITTKKGAEGRPTITYDYSHSFQKRYNYGVNRLNSQEYMNFVNVFSKEMYLYNNNQYPYGNIAYDGGWTPQFTQDEIDNATTTDWVGKVLRTGNVNAHNFSVTGGYKMIKYYLGFNYYDEQGIVRNSGMRRYTFRSNITAQLFPFLKLSAIVNLNDNSYNNALVGADTANKGINAAGSLTTAFIFPPNWPVKDERGEYTVMGMIPNPVATMAITDKSRQNGFYANAALDIDILKDMLAVRLVYGVSKDNTRRSSYIPSDVFFSMVKQSRGSLSYAQRQYETMEGMITFNKRWGDWVDLNAVVGMGRYVEKTNSLTENYVNAKDIINDANLGSADGPFNPASDKAMNEKRSQFARANVSLLDRYILALTLRRDGTDKFFKGKKYAWFPSVSLAWKLSSEPWLRDVKWLNLLKLRASYGKTGNDNLGSTLYATIGVSREDVKFNDGTTSYVPYLIRSGYYPHITWEKTEMKNIGLDFYVLNNRLWGSVDVFRNDVTDLLGWVPASMLSIFNTAPVNGGHFKRTGVEVTLNSVNIKLPNFTWTTSLSLSHLRQNWVEHMPNTDFKPYQKRKNEPISAMYYYDTDGLINMDRSNMPKSQTTLSEEAQKPGFPIIVDKNKDGKIDESDIYMKDMLPKVYYGFGNSFVWKNWDLDIYMYGQLGVEKNNVAMAVDSSPGDMINTLASNKNDQIYRTWNSQTNPNGDLPGIANRNVTLPGNVGYKVMFEEASFLRVRNITLGYTFDALKWKFLHGYVKNIRLYADIMNPFTITRYSDNDPEVPTNFGNLTNAHYPQLRAYTIGVKITF